MKNAWQLFSRVESTSPSPRANWDIFAREEYFAILFNQFLASLSTRKTIMIPRFTYFARWCHLFLSHEIKGQSRTSIAASIIIQRVQVRKKCKIICKELETGCHFGGVIKIQFVCSRDTRSLSRFQGRLSHFVTSASTVFLADEYFTLQRSDYLRGVSLRKCFSFPYMTCWNSWKHASSL